MRRSVLAHRALGLALAATVASTACSWKRFDEQKDSPPVVLLGRPSSAGGSFGSSLAVLARSATDVRLLVGSAPGDGVAAVYQLGGSDSPTEESLTSSYCNDVGICRLGSQIALADVLTALGKDVQMVIANGARSGALYGCDSAANSLDTAGIQAAALNETSDLGTGSNGPTVSSSVVSTGGSSYVKVTVSYPFTTFTGRWYCWQVESS